MGLNVIRDKPKYLANTIKSVLAIASGKGGVGKSTVSVQLALALKKRGYNVGILDADIYGPSLEQMLSVGMEPVESPNDPNKLLPALAFGIPYISVAHFRKKAQIIRAPIANQIIEEFIVSIDWGMLDYLIIDFPPGTGDIQLTLMQKANISSAIVVTTPQIVATLDVQKAIELFQKMQIPVLGVIENMSYLSLGKQKLTPFGKGGAEHLAKEFSLPILGQIPIDSKISRAGDLAESLFDLDPQGELVKLFLALSDQVVQEEKKISTCQIEVREAGYGLLEVKKEGAWRALSLHTLQIHCPCASCEKEKKSDPNVSLLEISYVGRYAIKILFSSGCSQGIYSHSLLTHLISSLDVSKKTDK